MGLTIKMVFYICRLIIIMVKKNVFWPYRYYIMLVIAAVLLFSGTLNAELISTTYDSDLKDYSSDLTAYETDAATYGSDLTSYVIGCGATKQECCSGDVCNSGLFCVGGYCRACGGLNGNCCATGDACSTGLVCQSGLCVQQSSGTNTSGGTTGTVCGALWQACCAGNTCN